MHPEGLALPEGELLHQTSLTSQTRTRGVEVISLWAVDCQDIFETQISALSPKLYVREIPGDIIFFHPSVVTLCWHSYLLESNPRFSMFFWQLSGFELTIPCVRSNAKAIFET